MALTFYNGSGSPFGWKVWLALEHKQIPYELKILSFSAGDTKKPEFHAINPRGKVPAIVDEGFALWESTAIVEYLEDRYPQNPILPGGANTRALSRRIALEADHYLYGAGRKLLEQTFFKPKNEQNPQIIADAKVEIAQELSRFDRALAGEFFVGPLSIADFTVYPFMRLLTRLEEKQPEHEMRQFFSPKLKAWMKRIESLPYYEKTTPPHWKE